MTSDPGAGPERPENGPSVPQDDFPRPVRVSFRFDSGGIRLAWMATVPRVGEYVSLGDNVRRHVAEVEHDIDPENVPVTCWLKVGYA